MENNLQRFIDAQQNDFAIALAEIKRGRKQSHWMWYIFPQIQGLGLSSTSRYYAIKDLQEAADYLAHPVLGKRLMEISSALLVLDESNATRILGSPDDMKLKSSVTLFSLVPNADPVFKAVLEKFFEGKKDERTLQLTGLA
jgi:uncharacterized protein (DUF1810 family)